MIRQTCLMICCLVFSLFASIQSSQADSYSSADEAWKIGVVYYNSREYAKATEPMEAALKMAEESDVEFRLKIHRALLACYRLVPDMKKMANSVEYIVEHSESTAEKSLTRTSYMSYLHQRGLVDDAVKRYEKTLNKDENDIVALYLLSEIQSRLQNAPEKSIELTKRLNKLTGVEETIDVRENARLASQHMRARQYKEAAELYEKIGDLDESLAAWHWKEAATAWLKLGENEKALAAAKRSEDTAGEKRTEQLTHFWHRALGDVFLATGEPKLAIPHFKKAIETTNIQGYIDGTQISLNKAKEAVKSAE